MTQGGCLLLQLTEHAGITHVMLVLLACEMQTKVFFIKISWCFKELCYLKKKKSKIQTFGQSTNHCCFARIFSSLGLCHLGGDSTHLPSIMRHKMASSWWSVYKHRQAFLVLLLAAVSINRKTPMYTDPFSVHEAYTNAHCIQRHASGGLCRQRQSSPSAPWYCGQGGQDRVP